MTRDEAIKAGFTMDAPEGPGPAPVQQSMTRAEAIAAGFTDEAPDQPAPSTTAAPDLSNRPVTAFAMNAADSASLVGLPAVLAGSERLIEEGPVTTALKFGYDKLTGDKHGRAKAQLDRYYARKAEYQGGMDRLAEANPKAATAGQFATALIPGGAVAKGAKFLPTVLRGAATGLATGTLRGPSKTMEGDFVGTAKDAGIGVLAGGVLAGAGSAVGKVAEAGGGMARKGMARVMAEVKKRTNSDIGTARNLAGQGAGAVENAWIKRSMDDDANKALLALRQRRPNARLPQKGAVPGLEHRNPAQVDRLLNRRSGNADAAMDKEQALFDKFGQNLREPKAVLNAKHLKDVAKESTSLLQSTALAAGMGYGGYKIAEGLGVDGRVGAAIGGAGGLYAVRKLTQNATAHPATLKKLMALTPIGKFIGRKLAAGATVPKNIAAIVYSMRDKPEVAKVLKEYEDQNGEVR